jgi:hypothetical protein
MSNKYITAYEPGDRIKDLTFDPAPCGTIVRQHEKQNCFYVQLDGGMNEVVIHARNLQREQP